MSKLNSISLGLLKTYNTLHESLYKEYDCMSDLWRTTNRTQQFGGVSHSGRTVVEGCGELWCLTEVVLRVLRRLVDDTCEHMQRGKHLGFVCKITTPV